MQASIASINPDPTSICSLMNNLTRPELVYLSYTLIFAYCTLQ